MNICMLSDVVKKEKRMPLIPDDIVELENKIEAKLNKKKHGKARIAIKRF